jgi:hypothetical protein
VGDGGCSELILSIPFPADSAEPTLHERKLQMVVIDNIAEVAAEAFANPQSYLGQAIEIAGRKCSAVSTPLDTLAQFWSQGVPLFRFIGEGGCDVDVAAMPKEVARLSFSKWLQRSGIATVG